MNLTNFLKQIPVISKERDYWFVRTDGGDYFDTFVKHGFIGLGWNKILLDEILKKDPYTVKQKIARLYKINIESTKGKTAASRIYNKLNRFANFQEGDVVICPSEASSRWAFGTVEGKPFMDSPGKYNCDFALRRNIQWDRVENFNDLDPIFNQIKTVHSALNNINKYASYIDIVSNSLYFKGDDAHMVLDIKTQDEINAKDFFALGNALMTVLEKIDKEYGNSEGAIDQTSLKLYLQSPGKVELKSLSKKSLVALGMLLVPLMAKDTSKSNSIDPALNNVIENTKNEVRIIQDSIEQMKIGAFKEIDDIYGK